MTDKQPAVDFSKATDKEIFAAAERLKNLFRPRRPLPADVERPTAAILPFAKEE
ncbi:hypothetical protein [Thalassospira lucentensis]|uniref:hypothetical protein n=1 Tax=Thalassospira lucentensis TaxID=168935 RepID=UPI0003B508F6|nr:hypothetical protein [Thalassospira lucentensis]